MKRRGTIGIVLLALSYFAFANVSSALAQAGSTGGAVGKRDKSISGGEEADTLRGVPHPKRSAAKSQESSSDHSCGRIVGRWTWYRGVSETVFNQNGTAQNSFGNTGKWTCAGATFRNEWVSGDKESYTIASDGHSMSVVSTWGGGVKFTATRRGQE